MIVKDHSIQCPFCGKRVQEIDYIAYGTRNYKVFMPEMNKLLKGESIYSEEYYFPCCKSEISTTDIRKGTVTLRSILQEETLLLPAIYPLRSIRVGTEEYFAFRWKNKLYIATKWTPRIRGVYSSQRYEVFILLFEVDKFRALYPKERIDKVSEIRLFKRAQTLTADDFAVSFLEERGGSRK